MQRVKLTKATVNQLPAPAAGEQVFYRDTDLIGFGLRVSHSAKSYFAEKRVRGRTVRVTLGRHGQLTPEQARRAAQRELGCMADGINPNARKKVARARAVTLREAFRDYLEVRTALRPSTIRHYNTVLRLVFSDWLDRPVTSITKDMVENRHARAGEERGKAYANLSMRVLRAVLNFARARYENADGRSLLPENPVARLSQTRAWFKIPRRQTVIEKSQLAPWFQAVFQLGEDQDSKGHVVRDYLLLLLFTGLRREEAARLRWQDVDLTARTLTVRQTKNGEPLTLPLSDFVWSLLQRRRQAGVVGYVFPGSGSTGHLVNPKRQVDKVMAASGVPFVIHDLRRTFVTVAESLDISAYAVKRLVNHRSSGDVTAGYVIHSVDRLREPMERIARDLLAALAPLSMEAPTALLARYGPCDVGSTETQYRVDPVI